ncbi:MAG: hypothetical protein ACFFDI_25410 [Promethearchaeota archaeon]
MENKNQGGNESSTALELAYQALEILNDRDRIYDLAGRRFAFYCVQVEEYFNQHCFRLGVLGNPNRGKTTFVASSVGALSVYGIQAIYADLDVYTQSGLAMFGMIGWEDRPKNHDLSEEVVLKNIQRYSELSSGLVVADFPGRFDNPYHADRLASTDLALILAKTEKERLGWIELAENTNTPWLWLESKRKFRVAPPILPFIFGLDRTANWDVKIFVILTRVIQAIAIMREISLIHPWPFFTEAERVVLEEVLDFLCAPLGGFDFT